MAKKSKSPKKHNFKYSQPVADVIEGGVRTESGKAVAKEGLAVDANEYNYVVSDLKLLGVLVLLLLALEIGLWVAFNNTGLGKAVYSLVKV